MANSEIVNAIQNPAELSQWDRIASHYWWSQFELDTLREDLIKVSSVQEGVRVLEMGCGNGAVTSMLVDRGAEMTCVDSSAGMLRAHRKLFGGNPQVSSQELDFCCPHVFGDLRVDRVVFAFTLEHQPIFGHLLEALRNARHCLNGVDGGRIVILIPHPDHQQHQSGDILRNPIQDTETQQIEIILTAPDGNRVRFLQPVWDRCVFEEAFRVVDLKLLEEKELGFSNSSFDGRSPRYLRYLLMP